MYADGTPCRAATKHHKKSLYYHPSHYCTIMFRFLLRWNAQYFLAHFGVSYVCLFEHCLATPAVFLHPLTKSTHRDHRRCLLSYSAQHLNTSPFTARASSLSFVVCFSSENHVVDFHRLVAVQYSCFTPCIYNKTTANTGIYFVKSVVPVHLHNQALHFCLFSLTLLWFSHALCFECFDSLTIDIMCLCRCTRGSRRLALFLARRWAAEAKKERIWGVKKGTEAEEAGSSSLVRHTTQLTVLMLLKLKPMLSAKQMMFER